MNTAQVLITGGAGFIGCNLANRLLSEGCELTIFDNLSRSGGRANIQWLREIHGENSFRLVEASLANFDALLAATNGAQQIYHLAGQVAVTTSIQDPRGDFEANALGTFNALEAARQVGDDPIFLYTSTNKVYGGMEELTIEEGETSYYYADHPYGVPETQPLDFHSPYGCSKGAGDQYTRDYARIYGLRTVVMRQSCIYGYRQFGIEDQGWIAWFIIAALKRRQISICGDGKQVRDILFVEDVLDVYQAAINNIETASGNVYNIGGGPDNTMSIWVEFGPMLEELLGCAIEVNRTGWRPGDQRVYISDIRKAQNELGWRPTYSVDRGIPTLFHWIRENKSLFEHL